MNWSRFIGRARSGERVYVRLWLRHKEPHFSVYGSPSVKIYIDGQEHTLIRVWTKVLGKRVRFGLRSARKS